MRLRLVPALPALLAALLSSATPAAPLSPAGRTCHLPGAEEALRCVTVQVPLDYGNPGRTIAVHATVAAAWREAARPDPLFVLAGGPGQAGSDILPLVQAAMRHVRATRDIVLIDQRGTGLSGKLDCKSPPGIDTMTEEQLDANARRCIASLARQGVRYSHYTTDAAARDIERVRLALGYRQVNLWGGSYGTRLAQHYARLYPSAVRALVLDGVAAPDQVIPAGGRDAQAALDATFAQCERDAACARAFPALRAEFRGLAERLARQPATFDMADPRTAAVRPVTIGLRRFIATVHRALYAQADARTLPFLIHGAYRGRWEPFVALGNRDGDFSADGAMAGPLYLAVVCAEDFPRLTPQLVADDTRGAFLGAPQVTQLAALCPAVGARPVAPAAPARIDAPALLLSGAQDPVTPPRRAGEAALQMTSARQLVVKNGGHIVSPLGCVPRLMREFLDRPGARVDAACLDEIAAPAFQLGSAGPQP